MVVAGQDGPSLSAHRGKNHEALIAGWKDHRPSQHIDEKMDLLIETGNPQKWQKNI